jgi:hypothetical protein
MNTRDMDRSSPSATPRVQTLPSVDDDRTKLEALATSLQTQLDDFRVRSAADIQSLQADVMGKNREIGRLKKELAAFRDDQPESGPVKELLILWKTVLNKNARTYIGLDGKRAKIAGLAIKKWGQPRCEKAIIGLSLQPWAGPRGRAAQEYHGSKRYDDIEHALGDEVRMENLVKVAAMYERPTLLDEPVGPGPAAAPLALVEPASEPEAESTERQFVRHVYGDDCTLPYVPASKEPTRRARQHIAPIDHVLGLIRSAGCEYRPARSPDEWEAQCPAHDDSNPSLVVRRNPEGSVWLKCWAGCSKESVLVALGADWADLFEDSEYDTGRLNGPAAKRVIPEHLRHAMRQLLERDEAAA